MKTYLISILFLILSILLLSDWETKYQSTNNDELASTPKLLGYPSLGHPNNSLGQNRHPTKKLAKKTTHQDSVTLTQSSVRTSSQNIITSETNAPTAQADAVIKKVDLLFQINAVTNTQSLESNNKTYGTELMLLTGINLNEDTRLTLRASGTKNLSQDYASNLDDSKLGLTKLNLIKTSKLAMHFSTGLIHPTSKESSERDLLQTAIEIAPTFILSLHSKFSFLYSPKYRRNFHRYTTNRENKTLAQDSLSQTFSVNYALTDKLSFGPELSYNIPRSYEQTERQHKYTTSLNLNYVNNKTISSFIGVRTGGNIIRPEQGKSKNIEFYNKDISEFYAGLSLSI